jgi:hypothetical protein
MLLGDSGVGKTCLLVNFKDGKFLDGNFIATVGMDFRVSPSLPLIPILEFTVSYQEDQISVGNDIVRHPYFSFRLVCAFVLSLTPGPYFAVKRNLS